MYNILSRIVPNARIFTKEPMANHTSFKIGGAADVYVQPSSRDELVKIIAKCRANNAPFVILGNGSNILVPDEGLRKIVIQLHPHFGKCLANANDSCVFGEAGASLSALAHLALQEGLTGLEFASGIPGTVGGAICMNAGAYGHDISAVCLNVDILMPYGEIVTVSGENMGFGYRASVLQQNNGIVLGAWFSLVHEDREVIKMRMDDINKRRKDSQPLGWPSAGSTFKRPPGHYAGKLISDCDLKGFSIGGAQVSQKHAGFIVNMGNAKANDVRRLIEHIQDVVFNRYGVRLEPEVEILCNL